MSCQRMLHWKYSFPQTQAQLGAQLAILFIIHQLCKLCGLIYQHRQSRPDQSGGSLIAHCHQI
jgi:hypothetical protein